MINTITDASKVKNLPGYYVVIFCRKDFSFVRATNDPTDIMTVDKNIYATAHPHDYQLLTDAPSDKPEHQAYEEMRTMIQNDVRNGKWDFHI